MVSINALAPTRQNCPARKPENYDWLWAALLLAAVFLVCNIQIATGRGAPIWDAEEFFAPAFTLIADHARAGRILLWNPWIGGGTPDYAEPELGAISPTAIVVGAITGGTGAGFRAYWLLIWFLGPLGLLILARHLRAPAWAGFVVATGFAFCGFYTAQAEHTSVLHSIAFLPWAIWRLDVALATRTLRPASEAGALWGLSALGGYPAHTILNGGFLFLWMLGRCMCPWEGESGGLAISAAGASRPSLWFGFCATALAALVGLPVLAPGYVAFFSEGGQGYSDRGAATGTASSLGVRPRAQATSDGLLQVGALSTFASPYLTTLKYGGENSRLWPRTDISLANIYLGGATTVLGLLAMVGRPQSLWRWWLLAVASFFLACALGSQLPVRGWLYDYCPPTRYFRNPAMMRVYAMVCAMLLALLAGKDLQAAIRNSAARIWKQFSGAAILVSASAAAAYWLVLRRVPQRNVENLLQVASAGFICVWLGCAGIAALTWFRPQTRRRLPVLLGVVAIIDAGLAIHVGRPTVYSTAAERQVWNRIDANHRSSLDLTRGGFKRDTRPPRWISRDCPVWWTVCTGPDVTGIANTNENIPLKIATFFNYVTLSNRFQTDFERHPVLAGMATGSDRIWFATETAMVAPSDAFYAAFVSRSESLGAPVLVTHPPPQMGGIRQRKAAAEADRGGIDAISQLPAARRVAAQLIRYTPNVLDFATDCPAAGWLLVTDRWSRGWEAKVNGQPAQVFAGDFMFRAVRVRAGENRIRFDYIPAGWPVLPVISWATLALVFVGPRVVPKRLITLVGKSAA